MAQTALKRGPISIDFEPMPAIHAMAFNVAAQRISDFRTPLRRAVTQVIRPSVAQNFDEEGRPHWQALSEFTIFRRMEEGFGEGPILQRTGTLKKVATSSGLWSFKRSEAIINSFPSDAWYGKVQHEGTGISAADLATKKGLPGSDYGTSKIFPAKRGDVVIPARPFMVIQQEDIDPIEDVFINWIREVLATSGFRPGVG